MEIRKGKNADGTVKSAGTQRDCRNKSGYDKRRRG